MEEVKYDRDIVHNVHDSLIRDIQDLQEKNAALEAKVAELTSTNSEIMPCLVGVNGQPCRLGFDRDCRTPACSISRTA